MCALSWEKSENSDCRDGRTDGWLTIQRVCIREEARKLCEAPFWGRYVMWFFPEGVTTTLRLRAEANSPTLTVADWIAPPSQLSRTWLDWTWGRPHTSQVIFMKFCPISILHIGTRPTLTTSTNIYLPWARYSSRCWFLLVALYLIRRDGQNKFANKWIR